MSNSCRRSSKAERYFRSRKARTASWDSSPSIDSASQSGAWFAVSCHEMSRHQLSCCFAERVVCGSFAASLSATSSTFASSSPGGTAQLTSPRSAARGAGISSHIKMISRARRSPTKTGSHCVAPPAGTDPCSRPTCRMNASSTITAKSHAICSSLPPPTAMPLMRARVGSAKFHEVHVERDALRLAVLHGGAHLRARHPFVERRSVGELELGVLVAVRFAGWTSEDPPGSERCAGHFLAELRVTRIPLCVWRTLPQNDGFDHVLLLLSRTA